MLLHAKGEVVAILKLKGHVFPTTFRDFVYVRVLLVGKLPEARRYRTYAEVRLGRRGF